MSAFYSSCTKDLPALSELPAFPSLSTHRGCGVSAELSLREDETIFLF